ncbi:hypothetical protein BASA81_013876 [Batrachochytrium salamandrivorans]|nr:hypothetical protein BASA81_013876 [Batrachochytrium salamandrivorans]
MNQSPESVGEPFDFSPSELGMMQTDANPSTPDSHGDPDINTDPSTPDSHGDPDSNADPSTSDSHGDPDSNADPSTSNSHGNPGSDTNLSTLGVYGDSDSDSSSDTDDGTDPFPEEQGAASHSLDGSSSSYDMARPSFIAPISNDMSTPFGYHRAQKHKVAHRHGAGTIQIKMYVGQCSNGAIDDQSNHRDLSANQDPARKCKEPNPREEAGKLFLEASDKKMQLRELEKEIKGYKEYISNLKAQKKEELDATGSTDLQDAIDASVIDYKSKIEVAKILKKEIREGMKKAGELYLT